MVRNAHLGGILLMNVLCCSEMVRGLKGEGHVCFVFFFVLSV